MFRAAPLTLALCLAFRRRCGARMGLGIINYTKYELLL